MKTRILILVLLVIVTFGCGGKMPQYTSSGKKVLVVEGDISLYRNKPHIWAAKGKALLTREELLFIPTPYYWTINVNGTDTTVIKLNNIEELRKKPWALIFPFGLSINMKDGTSYSFGTVRRDRLIQEIQLIKN